MIPWRVRAHSTDHMSTNGRLCIAGAAPAKFTGDCLDSERAVRACDRRNRFEDLVPSCYTLRMVALIPPIKSTLRGTQVTLMPRRDGAGQKSSSAKPSSDHLTRASSGVSQLNSYTSAPPLSG